MMRSNDFTRQSLKRAIAEVTGVKYGVGPYTAAPKATTPQSSPLEDLIKQAEGMGIPVAGIITKKRRTNMKARIPQGAGGAGNMNQMMQRMQKMQEEMTCARAELEEKVYHVSAGGGNIEVEINGKRVSLPPKRK